MFYIKAEIAEGITIKAEINDENIFTICPECGAEHRADLQDAVVDGVLDLYGTAIYCAECSKTRAQQRMFADNRELHLDKWVPNEADKPALMAYFKDYYEGTKDNCGDGEEAAEALQLLNLVEHNPLRLTKEAIQEHFVDMYQCVGGETERYYAESPEIIRLINLTVSPDPLEVDE